MRLFHLELDCEPALAIELHARLTVVAVDETTRGRVVDALDGLLRGRASGLRGALEVDGAHADFAIESTSGPVLPGVPIIVRTNDIDVGGPTSAPSSTERTEARHADALHGLRTTEAALAEQQRIVDALRARYNAPSVGGAAVAPVAPSPTARASEPDTVRSRLRTYVDELQRAFATPTLSERERVQLLERGTVLAADASRLEVVRPASVRALLDVIDGLNAPSLPAPGADGASPVATLVRDIERELASARTGNGAAATATHGDAECDAEFERAVERLETLEAAVGSARSRALAVFAELESARRAGSAATPPERVFLAALRARLNRPMPASWVGTPPIVVDDVLVGCPANELADARDTLVDVAQRTQVVYVTADDDTVAWASALAPEHGVAVHPRSPG
jgi:hypothetical protein